MYEEEEGCVWECVRRKEEGCVRRKEEGGRKGVCEGV